VIRGYEGVGVIGFVGTITEDPVHSGGQNPSEQIAIPMRNWPIRVRRPRWFERERWTCGALGYRAGMARVMLGPDTRAIPERQRDAEVPETRAEEVIARVLHDFMRGNSRCSL